MRPVRSAPATVSSHTSWTPCEPDTSGGGLAISSSTAMLIAYFVSCQSFSSWKGWLDGSHEIHTRNACTIYTISS
jgi:hypothetical protein